MASENIPKISLKLSKHFFGAILVVVGVVCVWRGVWNLLDLYLFPGHPLLTNLVSISVGLLILYLPDKDLKELV